MSQHRVFLVATVDQIGNGATRWRIEGRAWSDLKIGDTVYLDVTSPDGDDSYLNFQIIRCRYDGVDIPDLSRDMTGEIVLRGIWSRLARE